jgi:hypothetical protein
MSECGKELIENTTEETTEETTAVRAVNDEIIASVTTEEAMEDEAQTGQNEQGADMQTNVKDKGSVLLNNSMVSKTGSAESDDDSLEKSPESPFFKPPDNLSFGSNFARRLSTDLAASPALAKRDNKKPTAGSSGHRGKRKTAANRTPDEEAKRKAADTDSDPDLK